MLRACKHITNSPVFGQLEWRSNGFLHHAETKHELAFGAWTSNRNSLLASMHNLSVSPRPPSLHLLLLLLLLCSLVGLGLTRSSLRERKDVRVEDSNTSNPPLRAPAALFFIKERDDEEMEEGDGGIAEGSVGGRRGMEAALFLDRLHHRSLPPPPRLLPSPPRYSPCLCPRAFLRKMNTHTHTHFVQCFTCPAFFRIRVRRHKVTHTHTESHDVGGI